MLHMLQHSTSCYQWVTRRDACSMRHKRDKNPPRFEPPFDERESAVECLELELYMHEPDTKVADTDGAITLDRAAWEVIDECSAGALGFLVQSNKGTWPLPADADTATITLPRDRFKYIIKVANERLRGPLRD